LGFIQGTTYCTPITKQSKRICLKPELPPHLNIFYSIEMGLQGKSWNEITANEKKEIKNILEIS
jgi:hypothetical protein